MKRLFVAVLVALAVPAGAASSAHCAKCNVVLVTFDALRADRLGTYGHTKPTSPAIDAFARTSTVFEHCMSQSATTVSAVPAILTGRFPFTDQLLHDITLRPDVDTIATVLDGAGYRTIAVISHTFAGCKYSGCRGVDVVSDAPALPETTVQTIARVERLLDAEKEGPFFLWVHVRVPHAPYDAGPARFAAMYDGPPGPTFFSLGMLRIGLFQALAGLQAHYAAAGEPVEMMKVVTGRSVATTPTAVRQLRALYDANVRLGDEGFGRLMAYLERRKLRERTVVVMAADHAEALGEHGVFGHNQLWAGMLHTPLIVHVPGAKGGGVDAPVMNVDILPTVATLVGVPLARPVRGRDLFGPRSPDDLQYAEEAQAYALVRRRQKVQALVGSVPMLREGADGKPGTRTVVMEEKLKVLGLWDLASDPDEARDLAKERQPLVTELVEVAATLRRSQLETESRRPAPAIFDRLKSLGYIEGDTDGDR